MRGDGQRHGKRRRFLVDPFQFGPDDHAVLPPQIEGGNVGRLVKALLHRVQAVFRRLQRADLLIEFLREIVVRAGESGGHDRRVPGEIRHLPVFAADDGKLFLPDVAGEVHVHRRAAVRIGDEGQIRLPRLHHLPQLALRPRPAEGEPQPAAVGQQFQEVDVKAGSGVAVPDLIEGRAVAQERHAQLVGALHVPLPAFRDADDLF